MIHRCNKWTGCTETFYDDKNLLLTWGTEAEAVAWLKQNYPSAVLAESVAKPRQPAEKWEQSGLFGKEINDGKEE
jgi:hypothetical protein